MAVALICCLAVISSCFVNQGLALNCYQCRSALHPNCMDKPDNLLLKKCPATATGCIIATAELKNLAPGIGPPKHVFRRCWTSKAAVGCEDTSDPIWNSSLCYCTTDGCNSSIPVEASIPVGGTALMLLIFALLWF